MRTGLLGAALAGAIAFSNAQSADAAFKLQIDVNSAVVTAAGGFDGLTHTGTLQITSDGNSTMFGVLIDDVLSGGQGENITITGEISLVNGMVTGGFFSVVVDATMDAFTANIVNGSGMVTTQVGQGFKIDGLLVQGLFSGNSYAGVDVSAWNAAEPLNGSFLTFAYDPDEDGIDDSADVDLYAFVPTPGAIALFGLGGLALARRKR